MVLLLCSLLTLPACGDGGGDGGSPGVRIETIAGGLNLGDGGPATATFVRPLNVAVDADGDVLVVDANYVTMRGIIRRVDAQRGSIATVNGPCDPFALVDPPGDVCDLQGFGAIAVRGTNEIFLSTYDLRVFRVDAHTGVAQHLAGLGGFSCANVPGAPPRETCLGFISDVALDASGNLFLADVDSGIVWRLDASFTELTVVAGKPESEGCTPVAVNAAVPASEACLHPDGIAIDPRGNVFIADSANDRIDRVDVESGLVTTIAGTSKRCGSGRGDGGLAAFACLVNPTAIEIAPDGSLLVADHDRIRRIDGATRVITTLTEGDSVGALALAPGGNLLFTEPTRVERLDLASGAVIPVAGNGTPASCGEGGPGHDACLGTPDDTTLAPDGSIYFVDTVDARIGRVDTDGRTTTVADHRTVGSCGEVGPQPDACLGSPSGITRDRDGSLYFADRGADVDDEGPPGRVRRLDPTTGTVTTIAGNCTNQGSTEALRECLLLPTSLLLDGRGGLYVGGGDGVHRIELATGTIRHVVGSRHLELDCHADGIEAADACVSGDDLALDAAGNLYVIGFDDYRVRRIDAATGLIDTVAGSGTVQNCGGDGAPATSACLFPSAIAIDGDRLIIATDGGLGVVDLGSGLIHAVPGLAAECGSAAPVPAGCVYPWDMEIDDRGRLVVAEPVSFSIRRVTLP